MGEWTGPLVRIYSAGGAHPVTWGPSDASVRTRMRWTTTTSGAVAPDPWDRLPIRLVDRTDGVVADPRRRRPECFGETGVIDRQTRPPPAGPLGADPALRLLRLTGQRLVGGPAGTPP